MKDRIQPQMNADERRWETASRGVPLTRTRLGLRRQSRAATALSSGRLAHKQQSVGGRAKSGVALRFPPQSEMCLVMRSSICVHLRLSAVTISPT